MRYIRALCFVVLAVGAATPALAFHNCVYRGSTGSVDHYYCPPQGTREMARPIPAARVRPPRIAPARFSPQALPSGDVTFVGPIHELAKAIAEQHGVRPQLVTSVIAVESNWNTTAVSRKGARGLMQLMPETARGLGVRNSFNPFQNIDGGVRHLKGLLDEFRDTRLALAAYNAGTEPVRACRCVPRNSETPAFVEKVLSIYRGHGW